MPERRSADVTRRRRRGGGGGGTILTRETRRQPLARRRRNAPRAAARRVGNGYRRVGHTFDDPAGMGGAVTARGGITYETAPATEAVLIERGASMGEVALPRPWVRRTLGSTVDVTVGNAAGVLTVGRDPQGAPCWVELRAGVHGSTLAGFTDALATAITTGLQHGAPAAAFTDALHHAVVDASSDQPAALLVEMSAAAGAPAVFGGLGR